MMWKLKGGCKRGAFSGANYKDGWIREGIMMWK